MAADPETCLDKYMRSRHLNKKYAVQKTEKKLRNGNQTDTRDGNQTRRDNSDRLTGITCLYAFYCATVNPILRDFNFLFSSDVV